MDLVECPHGVGRAMVVYQAMPVAAAPPRGGIAGTIRGGRVTIAIEHSKRPLTNLQAAGVLVSVLAIYFSLNMAARFGAGPLVVPAIAAALTGGAWHMLRARRANIVVENGQLVLGRKQSHALTAFSRAVPRLAGHRWVVALERDGGRPLLVGKSCVLDREGAGWLARRLNQLISVERK